MLTCLILLALLTCLATCAASREVASKSARVTLGEDSVDLDSGLSLLRLETGGGRLCRAAWVNKSTGLDLLGGHATEDFRLTINGASLSSAETGWEVAEPYCEILSHGELQVRLTLSRGGLQVTRHYVVFPGISLLRGWLEIANAGGEEIVVTDPPIVSVASANAGDLKWMTGAEQFGDSWKMRTETLSAEARGFDSYDPPPAVAALPGANDGTAGRILLNEKPVWPAEGWAVSKHANDPQTHDLTLDVQPGDRIAFVLSRRENMICDTTEWDPVITYADGEAHKASAGFSSEQGKGGWNYRYLSDAGEWRDLTYSDAPGRYGNRWRLDVNVIEPFVAADEMHPDPRGCAVRVFTAPQAGQVTVTGTFSNTGNTGPAGRGFRMGTMAYAPWFCVIDPTSGAAAYVGFDCMAHWQASFEQGAQTTGDVRLAGYSRQLKPGETIRTPYSFCGLFTGDLDDMGQEILEWQYQYLWHYTREPWFPATRMLGYWMKGTRWGAHGWVGGDPDYESTFRKVFRTADFMRETGGDTYHRDWGWWDKAGDWNGPDFRTTGQYLRKYDMGQLIYAFIYTVDAESSVAKAHPEWLADPATLDQSMPEVMDYEANLLDSFYQRWGTYQWRNDSTPISPRGGDDTILLVQQQGFMQVLRRFLDAHPDCAFQGVNGGGMALNWEYLGYASGFQFTDGQAQAHANYDASYLFPPDKINNMPDIWDPAHYDPATWRGLLCSNYDMTGDTFDEAKLEGLRDISDVYHYLQSRGVVGRWVRVYHPIITGDDETMYLQRMDWARDRGIIITKHKIAGTVNVRPKGLLPERTYDVGFHESDDAFIRTGAQLMAEGITLKDPAPGELIYLNLPDHPGSKLDKTPPTAPTNVTCRTAQNMGVPGVDVTWNAARDDHWLSYYVVARDGADLGKVAKGLYFFDHSAGADPAATYAVRAVDGSRNASPATASVPATGPRRQVLDDADPAITYTGNWQRETDFPPAHKRTLSSADAAGATFELHFRGRAVTWHSRLGADGGLARVTLDGGAPVTASCYAADEIPGWPVFEHEFAEAGQHVLRVQVLGERDPRSAGTKVWVDGVSIQ